jgi:predicted amidohydrolase
MVIDPLGEILYRGPATEEMQTVTLDGDHLSGVRSKYPFLRDADRFSISI